MTLLIVDFLTLFAAIGLGAMLMHWHEKDKAAAVLAERKNTERYRADAEGLRLAAARRDVLPPRDWPEHNWSIVPSLTEQETLPELMLDEKDETELKEKGAVVRVRRSKK